MAPRYSGMLERPGKQIFLVRAVRARGPWPRQDQEEKKLHNPQRNKPAKTVIRVYHWVGFPENSITQILWRAPLGQCPKTREKTKTSFFLLVTEMTQGLCGDSWALTGGGARGGRGIANPQHLIGWASMKGIWTFFLLVYCPTGVAPAQDGRPWSRGREIPNPQAGNGPNVGVPGVQGGAVCRPSGVDPGPLLADNRPTTAPFSTGVKRHLGEADLCAPMGPGL